MVKTLSCGLNIRLFFLLPDLPVHLLNLTPVFPGFCRWRHYERTRFVAILLLGVARGEMSLKNFDWLWRKLPGVWDFSSTFLFEILRCFCMRKLGSEGIVVFLSGWVQHGAVCLIAHYLNRLRQHRTQTLGAFHHRDELPMFHTPTHSPKGTHTHTLSHPHTQTNTQKT